MPTDAEDSARAPNTPTAAIATDHEEVLQTARECFEDDLFLQMREHNLMRTQPFLLPPQKASGMSLYAIYPHGLEKLARRQGGGFSTTIDWQLQILKYQKIH
jgi:hypothetical protein